MTHDDVIRMAREAGFWVDSNGIINGGDNAAGLLDFAVLVAAAEREACAKLCEEGMFLEGFGAKTEEPMDKRIGKAIANAIRARGDG